MFRLVFMRPKTETAGLGSCCPDLFATGGMFCTGAKMTEVSEPDPGLELYFSERIERREEHFVLNGVPRVLTVTSNVLSTFRFSGLGKGRLDIQISGVGQGPSVPHGLGSYRFRPGSAEPLGNALGRDWSTWLAPRRAVWRSARICSPQAIRCISSPRPIMRMRMLLLWKYGSTLCRARACAAERDLFISGPMLWSAAGASAARRPRSATGITPKRLCSATAALPIVGN